MNARRGGLAFARQGQAIVAFSQRDPRWANERLGTSEYTLGQAGCLVTAAAALLASWGADTDPRRLNEYLRQVGGYVEGGLFVFASVNGLAGARFEEFIDCPDVAAPVERLRQKIARGAGVLACFDFVPGGSVQTHWTWLLRLDLEDGQLMDPWQPPGQEAAPLSRYLAAGWTPARGIFQAAVYHRQDRVRSLPGITRQSRVCVRVGGVGE
jgi:hypothetical protein